jgi:2-oxoisovalerate dehydrogenase E1 component
VNLKFIKKALLIRKFEQKLLDIFSEGKLNGTVHTCVGQELTPTVINDYLIPSDMIFSNHRGHGHFIAHCGQEMELLKEILGRKDGISKGIGGSQHLKASNFISNGIQGGLAAVAAGHAFAKNDGISVCYVGDGTLGEGQFYEAINLAKIFSSGVLYVIENNGYAQSTKTSHVNFGDLKSRMRGFGLDYFKANIWSLDDLKTTVGLAVENARSGKPTALEVGCYRLNSHSKGDDNRDTAEVQKYSEKDLLNIFKRENPSVFKDLEGEVDGYIENLLKTVASTEEPIIEDVHVQSVYVNAVAQKPYIIEENKNIRVNQLINNGLDEMLSNGAYLIGEDIVDTTEETPLLYGGAFKVTKGLSTKYPDRVSNTSISEAGIVGFGLGIALSGRQAIVEIMFGDFLTLAFDQILQQISKIKYMFGTEIKLPLTIRTPMGARRGYGPTHSQNIEKHFLFIPGVNCLALNYLCNPEIIYRRIAEEKDFHLVIEDKVSYTKPLARELINGYQILESEDLFPIYTISPKSIMANLVIFVYGAMLEEVMNIVDELLLEDIVPTIISPTLLSPINLSQLQVALSESRRLIFVEEGSRRTSLSSEVISSLMEFKVDFDLVGRISNESIIPCDKRREEIVVPSALNLTQKIIGLVNDY